jgi:hypothetical protein
MIRFILVQAGALFSMKDYSLNYSCSEPSGEDAVVEVVCPIRRRREGAMSGITSAFMPLTMEIRSDFEVKYTD